MTSILSVRDLEKTFGSVVAAQDINVDIPAGQTVGVIGANGAGKTTFVNMITGHLKPSKGRILFEGRDIAALPSRQITQLGLARSFQVAQIFTSLSVRENMIVAAAIARGAGRSVLARALTPLHHPEVEAEADAAIALFGIHDYIDAPASTLPQGVRKLLDIAMAMAAKPRILLLDEPTSGISAEEKYDIMEVVISALRDRKVTVLFVEHDMEIVRRFTDRVLAFYEGRVIADAPPEEALADQQVRELVTGVGVKRRASVEATSA